MPRPSTCPKAPCSTDIYINGKKIDYLTLNGKDFFKGKNRVMLDNLPYYTVQNIKVYHKDSKTSRLAGRTMERKDYVMDVNLKREYNRGYMANAEAGIGTKERYMARLFGLYYDDHSRASFYGNTNNVNETRKPGSEGDWKPSDMPEGLTATRTTGIDLSTEDADKHFEEELSAQLTWSDADNESRSQTQQYTAGENISGGTETFSRKKDFSFALENKFTLNKPLRLYSTLSLDYTHGKGHDRHNDSTYRSRIINQSHVADFTKHSSLSLKGSLSWYKELEWGDLLALETSASYSRQKPTDTFTRRDIDYADPTADRDMQHREQYNDTHSDGYHYGAEAAYIVQLPDKWAVMLTTAFRQTQESAYHYSYRLDWLADTPPHELGWLPTTQKQLDDVLDTDHYDMQHHLTRQYTGQLMVQHSTENSYFHIALPLHQYNERMHYVDVAYDTIARRRDLVFEPEIMFAEWGKRQTTLSFRTRVERPPFASLIESSDFTNPLLLLLNNPQLKNRITHTLYAYMNCKADSTDLQWHTGLTASLVQREWGRRTTFLPTGLYIYMSDNVSGNWNASLSGGLNGSLDHDKRLRFQLDTQFSFVHSIDYAVTTVTDEDERMSRVNTLNSTMKGKMEYSKGDLTAGVNAQLTLRNSQGNRDNFEHINACDYQYGLNAKYTVPRLKLNIATDLTMFSRRGYSTPQMNTNDLVWNAQIARSIMKDKLTLRLQAFDLLHRLSSKQYSVNAQGYTETWTNCIPRYVMLSAIYKFSKK